MKRYVFYITAIVVTLTLFACVTPQQRRNQLATKYPNWSQDTLSKVSLGLVQQGMTKEQVREALILPPRYDVEEKGDRWSYVNDIITDRDANQYMGKILFFKDDKLVKIRNFMRIPERLIYIEWPAEEGVAAN